MTGERAARHVETDMAATGAALLRRHQRKIGGIGHEIRLQQKALLFALGSKIIDLAGEAFLEVVGIVEDEIQIVVHVDDRRRERDRDVARGGVARTVEMLMPAIQRDREDRPVFPFEGDALARVVPYARAAAPA